MSYPVEVPPSPIAATLPTVAIVAQSRSTQARDLAPPSILAQTRVRPFAPSAAVPENLLEVATTPLVTSIKSGVSGKRSAVFIASDTSVQPKVIAQTVSTPLPPAQAKPELLPAPSPVQAPPNQLLTPPSNPDTPIPIDQPPEGLKKEGVIELLADRQTFDRDRQVFTAEGNVSMRFRESLVVADRLQVNLLNRFAVAEGNVTLTRGEQILQGNRFEYNFVQGEGKIRGARGEVFIPELSSSEVEPLPTDISASRNIARPIGQRIYSNQPAQNVQAGGGLEATVGARSNLSGQRLVTGNPTGKVSRLRFEADSADFYPEGLVAKNVRITNDPFSPPELELRAPKITVTRLSPLRDEIKAEKPRLVFDQRFKLPLLRNRIVIDRRRRTPAFFQIGFDSDERGGLFLGREIDIVRSPNWNFSVTPQFLVQRAIADGFGANSFGLKLELDGNLGPRSIIKGRGSFSTLDFGDVDDRFRGSLRAQQLVGSHTLSLEASYRDRLFNNSLGFQNVRSSIGLLFYSPAIALGKTGIGLSYQVGYQRITANTDRLDLLDTIRPNDRISLNRFQSSVSLSRGFNLWRGKPLPATKDEGLRYTPVPLVPYVDLAIGATGTASLYSNGENQRLLSGSVSLRGQFGHSSRNTLDYTALNVTYTNATLGGLSPFLFDRAADTQVLFAGITQQIYGPWRLGFQTAWNLDTGNEISTDYILEYSRRTHGFLLRYNPIQRLGSISLNISDFNWTGGSEPFGGSGVRGVNSGVLGSAE